MTKNLIGAAALIVALAVPSVAVAHRTASFPEKVAIAGGAHESRTPLRCLGIDVSTVVRGYAGLTFNARNLRSCERYGFNAVVVLRRVGNRWHQIWAGSDGYPPIPRRIFTDLYKGLTYYFG
jgi:hypothetical protein